MALKIATARVVIEGCLTLSDSSNNNLSDDAESAGKVGNPLCDWCSNACTRDRSRTSSRTAPSHNFNLTTVAKEALFQPALDYDSSPKAAFDDIATDEMASDPLES